MSDALQIAIINGKFTLLNQRIDLLNSINNIGIIWWTTTIVFSVTTIALLWRERENIGQESAIIRPLKIFLSTFFVSTVIFGVAVIFAISKIKQEYTALLTAIEEDTLIDTFAFLASQIGYGIGTVNFFIVTCLWFGYQKNIGTGSDREASHPGQKPERPSENGDK